MTSNSIKYKILRKFPLLLLLSILLLLFLPYKMAQVHAEDTEPKTLRVAFPEMPGMSEIDENGRHSGLVVDYLNEIAKYTNWNYEFIETGADTVTEEFIAGNFDIMGGVYYDPSFEQYFAYPKYTMGSSNAVLFCRKDDTSIHSYDLSTLNGKTIGVYKNAEKKITQLKDYLSSHDLKCNLKYYSNEDSVDGNFYSYLEHGDVDLLLGNDMEVTDFLTVASFESQAYYLVAQPGSQEILDGLNMALEKIMDSNPGFAEKAYQENFLTTKIINIQFTDVEKEYIAQSDTIRVAAMKNWNPFYYSDADGAHNGIIRDVLDEITQLTGLRFQLIYADTYEDTIKLVKSGEASVLGCFLDSEYDALGQDLVLTSSYMTMNNTVIKNKAVNYPGKNLKAGIIAGRSLPPEISAGSVSYYKNVEDGLDSVADGEIDFMYGLSTSIEQSMQSRRFTNLSPMSLVNNSSDVCFALARPAPTELLTILNKGINAISSNDIDSIIDRNIVSMAYSAMSLSDLIYASPVTFVTVIGIILLLVLIGILITVRFRVKNTLMQNELEKAESQSRAKGEFLSRMSHEIRTPMNAIAGLAELTCMLENVPKKVENNLKKILSSSQYLLSLINDILDMSRIDSGMMVIASEDFSIREMLDDLSGMMRVQASRQNLHCNFKYHIVHDKLSGDSIRLRQVLTNLLSNAVKFTPAGGTVTMEVHELSCDNQKVRFHFSVSDTGIGISPEDQELIFGTFEQIGPNRSKSEGTGLGLPISKSIVQLMGGDLNVTSAAGEGAEFYFTLDFALAEEKSGILDTAVSVEKSSDSNPEVCDTLSGKRILLAEDNDLNAEIAEEILNLKGIKTERVRNGKEALERFLSNGSGYYKLILMDIRMPVMDGHAATVSIRSSAHPDAQKIPIIAMTANSFQEDVEAAKTCGMNGFIPKPFDSNNLFETLTRHIL